MPVRVMHKVHIGASDGAQRTLCGERVRATSLNTLRARGFTERDFCKRCLKKAQSKGVKNEQD